MRWRLIFYAVLLLSIVVGFLWGTLQRALSAESGDAAFFAGDRGGPYSSAGLRLR